MLIALIHGTGIVYYRYDVAFPIISGYPDYGRSGGDVFYKGRIENSLLRGIVKPFGSHLRSVCIGGLSA